MMNNPRGQIVNRSTLLKEVDTDTARLLEQVADMDDLVLQFDGTDAGVERGMGRAQAVFAGAFRAICKARAMTSRWRP